MREKEASVSMAAATREKGRALRGKLEDGDPGAVNDLWHRTSMAAPTSSAAQRWADSMHRRRGRAVAELRKMRRPTSPPVASSAPDSLA